MLAALTLAASIAVPTRLKLEAWTGANVATATSAARKYRLHVAGPANAKLVLRASGLAPGWLAAFCTPSYCAPMRVDVTLPATGEAVFQFELIREDAAAPARTAARITSDDGASVSVTR